jgi:hypothetical protein
MIILCGFLISAGCQTNSETAESPLDIVPNPGDPPLSTPQPGSPTNSRIITSPTFDRFDTTATKMPERVPPTDAFPPITGEVPGELLDSILKDLSERTGIPREMIVIIEDQAVLWNDGSLGCAKPGEFYTQALVNGYRVILEINGETYDYRASDRGYFFLCEGRFRPTPPTGTPSS